MQDLLALLIVALPVAFVGLVVFDFVSGLISLWHRIQCSMPNAQCPLVEPLHPCTPEPYALIPDPWESEVILTPSQCSGEILSILSVEPAPVVLCLPPAREAKPVVNVDQLNVRELRAMAKEVKLPRWGAIVKGQGAEGLRKALKLHLSGA